MIEQTEHIKDHKQDLSKAILLIAGIRQADIPQWFFLHCREFINNPNSIHPNILQDINDPVNSDYWVSWVVIKEMAEIKALNGKIYTLYQPDETTLYLIPKKEESKND